MCKGACWHSTATPDLNIVTFSCCTMVATRGGFAEGAHGGGGMDAADWGAKNQASFAKVAVDF
jgi:hypothetical protein